MRRSPPPPAVLRAFGATDPPMRLAGGMGATWRSGNVVLKPLDGPPALVEWEARVLAAAGTDRVRMQQVLPARDGALVVDGWVAKGLPPGIIDFSPYWRPSAYAVGVVVADAVVWQGAELGLVDRVADRPEMSQCLIRALIFRHVTGLLLQRPLPGGDAARRYARLRAAAIRLP